MSSIESVTCEQSEGEHTHFSMVRWSVILVGLVYFSIAGLVHENELGPCRKEDTVGTDAARTPRDRSGRTGEGGERGRGRGRGRVRLKTEVTQKTRKHRLNITLGW